MDFIVRNVSTVGHVPRSGIHQANGGTSATATVEWDINITVDSVRQGGLEIIMNLPENESDWFKVTTEHTDNWLMDGGTMAQVADEVAGHVEDRTSIREVANELQNALKGTGKFVFPGAGTFLYKNPMYNNELDLLVETSYNGYVAVLVCHFQIISSQRADQLTVNPAEWMISLVARRGADSLQSPECGGIDFELRSDTSLNKTMQSVQNELDIGFTLRTAEKY